MGAPGGAAQQRRGTKAEKGRDQCRSCGLGAAASGPTRTAQFRQSPGTMEREKAGRAGSWTPISGGCGGTRGLSCPGGGRSEGEGRAGPGAQAPSVGRGLPPPGASWRRGPCPELLSSLSTEGGSRAGREPTRPLSCPRQKQPRWTPGPAAGGLGPCQAWLLADPALARWGAKPPGWGR